MLEKVLQCRVVLFIGGIITLFYDNFIEYGAVVNISNLQNEEIGQNRKMLKLSPLRKRQTQEKVIR